MEFKCPECHSLIYSRRAKICGQCGASLPAELLLTDEQVRTLDDDRKDAKLLAETFGNNDASDNPSANKQDFSAEFHQRKRLGAWLYAVGAIVTVVPIIFLSTTAKTHPLSWIMLIGFVAAASFWAWRRGTPICPNCHQNIKLCTASHCLLCGEILKNKHCSGCQADHSWVSYLTPFINPANRNMAHCPGCGVKLDSRISRWEGFS